MKLKEILENINTLNKFNPKLDIKGISYDSRTVKNGDLFVALPGEKYDGTEFTAEALNRGAVAIVSEKELDISKNLILVESARYALSVISSNFYKYNQTDLQLIGITGTNGKTTISHLIKYIFSESKIKSFAIGTLGYLTDDGYFTLKHTTPEAPELYKILRELNNDGYKVGAIEVSSHGLVKNRVSGISFKGAIFTNLTQDHLDFHKNMEDYYLAKRRLFEALDIDSFGLVNVDDRYGKRLFTEFGEAFLRISLFDNSAEYYITSSNLSIDKSAFKVKFPDGNIYDFESGSIGHFNLYNLLFGIAVGDIMGVEIDIIQGAILSFIPPTGRLQMIKDKNSRGIYVDYAHTPDALERVLKTLRELFDGKIITVFGCGGNRDKDKRPLMGGIASKYSDKLIITSDNPRSEEPEKIIDEIIKGIPSNKVFERISSRKDAIHRGIELSDNNSLLLIAGKGHEDYQIIGDKVIKFSDIQVVREYLKQRKRNV